MPWKDSVERTLLHTFLWKGAIQGTFLCFIYHRRIKEGTLAVFFFFYTRAPFNELATILYRETSIKQ